MLLTLLLPQIGELMTTACVRTIHGTTGTPMEVGSKLIDLTVDLSAVAEQDCPPMALYRIALGERAWLRELSVAPGDEIAVGAPLARLTTEPCEPLDAVPARSARISVAGIVDPSGWWQTG